MQFGKPSVAPPPTTFQDGIRASPQRKAAVTLDNIAHDVQENFAGGERGRIQRMFEPMQRRSPCMNGFAVANCMNKHMNEVFPRGAVSILIPPAAQ